MTFMFLLHPPHAPLSLSATQEGYKSTPGEPSFLGKTCSHRMRKSLMLLASCVNTPIDHNVFHYLRAHVARCSASCVNRTQEVHPPPPKAPSWFYSKDIHPTQDHSEPLPTPPSPTLKPTHPLPPPSHSGKHTRLTRAIPRVPPHLPTRSHPDPRPNIQHAETVIHFRRQMEIDVSGGKTAVLRRAVATEQTAHGTKSRLPL